MCRGLAKQHLEVRAYAIALPGDRPCLWSSRWLLAQQAPHPQHQDEGEDEVDEEEEEELQQRGNRATEQPEEEVDPERWDGEVNAHSTASNRFKVCFNLDFPSHNEIFPVRNSG